MAMNGNDEATYGALASEVQQIQLSPRKSPPPPDNEEKAIHLRFLLSNAEAGSVIGKGGATINDIQSQSGARVQLSRNFEYFPGTSDRIIMVSGTVDEVSKGVDITLSKLLDEFYVEDGGQIDTGSKLKLVVPNSSCGGIIGKGGANIRSLIEESGAGIKITSQDMGYPGLHDRLVIVSGTLSEQMRAVDLILLKLVDDQYYQQSPNVPFPYAALVYNGMNYGPNGVAGNYPNNNRFPNKEERSISETIGIADEHIGLVVGRGGRNIMEISQISGAKIKISDRGDFIAGTSDRKVTITGSERAIHAAESMISRKLASVNESQS